MTRDFAIWVALVVVGASCMFLHVLLLIRTCSARELPREQRLLALLPPLTPVMGWRVGARTLTCLWGGSGLLYCLLRILAIGHG